MTVVLCVGNAAGIKTGFFINEESVAKRKLVAFDGDLTFRQMTECIGPKKIENFIELQMLLKGTTPFGH